MSPRMRVADPGYNESIEGGRRFSADCALLLGPRSSGESRSVVTQSESLTRFDCSRCTQLLLRKSDRDRLLKSPAHRSSLRNSRYRYGEKLVTFCAVPELSCAIAPPSPKHAGSVNGVAARGS